jgi:hypothetical protein
MSSHEELYPKVIVFHNAIDDIDKFSEMIQDGSEFVFPWTDWYDLGKETNFTHYGHIATEKFPSPEEWAEKFDKLTNIPAKQALSIFYNCTKEYVEKYNVDIPNWVHPAPYILCHLSKNNDRYLTMQYHTDFVMSKTENPGFKFWITGLLYVNDDYEGGELAFKIFKNENEVIDGDDFEHFSYKPKAGDFLVMPAHHPFYHGVKKTTTNKKLFIRMFWGYDYQGSEEWLAKEQEYGKEIWATMEKERIERETGKWMRGAVEENNAPGKVYL